MALYVRYELSYDRFHWQPSAYTASPQRPTPYQGFCLHGFNALYLGSIDRWVRVDASGNTNGIDAQFGIEREQLAFPVREELGEWTYGEMFAEPAEAVLAVLQSYDDFDTM
ncbi:MAG TPA: hypothetical protein EYG11_18045 [Candidatus Latescibacteria bacterium]|nr:hypothetical protein [Candidatus Handelsmanbacteria bacterium]HIL10606.1 hypothetical protein [Candidatus Latescibacterota bacterium]